jgi:NADPH:quinone reductase
MDMRAFAILNFGETPAVHDLPVPAADGAYLIRITYAGANPIDYKLVKQLTAGSAYPFVVGVDFAGVVKRVPRGDNSLQAGDRVFGEAWTNGAYAEFTAVVPGQRVEPLARIPNGVSDEQAAALPVSGIAALGSLELLQVTAGQRLVVMGATGGVGGYAVQIARARGGAHVIATVHGDVEEARSLGADEVYDARATDAIDAIRASHPDGIDAILDLVNGSDAIQRDCEILRPGGALVSTIGAVAEAWFAERHIRAYNLSSSNNTVQSSQGLDRLARMMADGTIAARINSTFELDEAGEMFEKLQHGDIRGKAVIRVSEPDMRPEQERELELYGAR